MKVIEVKSKRPCSLRILLSVRDAGLSAKKLSSRVLVGLAVLSSASGLATPFPATVYANDQGNYGGTKIEQTGMPSLELQSPSVLTDILSGHSNITGDPMVGEPKGETGDSGPRASLGNQTEPEPPNPLIYLDIWLFGGLILLVMAVVAVKYLVKLFRPDNRDPEEGLQPWEDPDYYYDDTRE